MNQYKIYVAPSGTFEAVKQGWSWPAFFWPPFWPFFKRLWAIGLVTLPLCVFLQLVLSVLEHSHSEGAETISGLVAMASIVICFIFGASGNSWREKNLVARNYNYTATVSASSPAAAVLSMRAVSRRSPIMAGSDLPAPRIENSEFKQCPFCAETIRTAAIKCKHCASNIAASTS